MQDYIEQNRKAWEYDAYNFWVRQCGTPKQRAAEDSANPLKALIKYAHYFETFEGQKIANICGSCGKKAVPLALLGADVTVFDISEANKRYACETAAAAGTSINYVVGDVLSADLTVYGKCFDVVFMEGGVLHYFHDISFFFSMMNRLLKNGGRMICSDFHPLQKVFDVLELGTPAMSYFCTDIIEGEMAHARFYPDEERAKFPRCSIRKYTLSDIINSVIRNGFTLDRFDEHPAWTNSNLPGEFTLIAHKNSI